MVAKDYAPVLEGTGDTDYARYMRTDELLSLQRQVGDLVHRDEMLFQTVHQTTELWLKYACFEVDEAIALVRCQRFGPAAALLDRAARAIGALTAQLDLLACLPPSAFQTVRTALGNGSGYESPGWRGAHVASRALAAAFDQLVVAQGIDLVELYRRDPDDPLYRLAEAMVEWDDRIATWRARHFKIATRIIGRGAVGTKGAPVQALIRLIDHHFFPALWDVRTRLSESGPMAGRCPVNLDNPLVAGHGPQ